MSNYEREIGANNENDAVDLLRQYHYWIYHTPHKQNGQPVDIIAIRDDKSFLIDAKHVENGISFSFNDIEPNQLSTFYYAKNYANLKNLGFAIHFKRGEKNFYWFSYDHYLACVSLDKKSIRYEELVDFVEIIK